MATADTAAKAACRLFDRGWSGYHRVGVHGPRDLSSDEAAAIISSALGEPVKCVEATLDQARGAMKGMGMPDFVVEILIEQYAAFREGPLGFGRAAHARHDDPHDARRVRADHARARDQCPRWRGRSRPRPRRSMSPRFREAPMAELAGKRALVGGGSRGFGGGTAEGLLAAGAIRSSRRARRLA